MFKKEKLIIKLKTIIIRVRVSIQKGDDKITIINRKGGRV